MPKEQLAYSTYKEIKEDMSLKRKSLWRECLIARHLVLIMMIILTVDSAYCADVSLIKIIADSENVRSVSELQGLTNSLSSIPTYRVEQLIISQPGNTTVISWHGKNYTSLFDKDFVHQLLDLQNAITEISVLHNKKNITLQDICFAPLKPDNNCTILSIPNYYQNSHERIDKEVLDEFGWFIVANYLNHFEFCVKNPTSANSTDFLHLPCLGTFGGPVFPWAALDQYTGDSYETSKAFVITILVNNYQDPILNEPAKAWELKFVEFMAEYINTHKNIDIVVSSGVDSSLKTRYRTG